MIEVKSFYTDWHETDAETAKGYIKGLLIGYPDVAEEDIPALIEGNHLRGITYEELMKS